MKHTITRSCDTCGLTHTEKTVYYCNFCRKAVSVNEDNQGDVIDLSYSYSYGSPFDGDVHKAHICEKCYETVLIPKMQIHPRTGNFMCPTYTVLEDNGPWMVLLPLGYYIVRGRWTYLKDYVKLDDIARFSPNFEPGPDTILVPLPNGEFTLRSESVCEEAQASD